MIQFDVAAIVAAVILAALLSLALLGAAGLPAAMATGGSAAEHTLTWKAAT